MRENPYTVDAPLATYARGWNLDALRWLPQTGTRQELEQKSAILSNCIGVMWRRERGEA